MLEYLFSAATIAVGWSRYFVRLLDYLHIASLPAALTTSPFTVEVDGASLSYVGNFVNLPAVLISLTITAICYVGIRQSAAFNAVVVAIKVGIIVLGHRVRRVVRQGGQLDAIHSAQHRDVWKLRVVRGASGIRNNLLRVHRIRCRIHSRAGSQEPGA